MSKIVNHAAYLTKAKAHPLQVSEAPLPPLDPKSLRIKVHALAINPIDHILQTQGTSLGFPWLKYPLVLGSDVSGTVVELGSSVNDFTVGDRVLGQCLGTDKAFNATQNAEAGFQEYCVLRSHMTAKIPDTLPFEQACVVPLALSTAACALYQKDYLGLPLPQPATGSSKPTSSGQTIVIWGGSTSVGAAAIQLAVASGYEVITTCSPKNNEYCRTLGATHCFDYNSPTVVQSIRSILQNKTCPGALAIGEGSPSLCMDILAGHVQPSQGTNTAAQKVPIKPFLAVISGPSFPSPERSFHLPRTIATFVSFLLTLFYKGYRHEIPWKFVIGTSPAKNEVGPAIYNEFLPGALLEETREFRAVPEAVVVEQKGLEGVQGAMDLLREGNVGRAKVVVKLV